MNFNYDSMYAKYEIVTGKPWNDRSSSLSDIRKSPLTKVSLNEDGSLPDLVSIRDWCQDNFGDNWIHEWHDFYFKNEADAIIFRLRYA